MSALLCPALAVGRPSASYTPTPTAAPLLHLLLLLRRHGTAPPLPNFRTTHCAAASPHNSPRSMRVPLLKNRGRTSQAVAGGTVAKVWIFNGYSRARDAPGQLCATAMPQPGDEGVRARHAGGRELCVRCVAERNDDEQFQTQVGNGPSIVNNKTDSEKKLLTLPTILTLTRVAAVPALLAVFYSQETWATTAGATIFVLAALTDWLDGYLARKMGSSSEFGAFLDPVADKLMVATTLVLLCTRPPAAAFAKVAPWLLPLPAIAIIGREITMSALREWAASQGGDIHKAVAVNSLGKWKTASQMVALTLLLVTRDGGGGAALGAAGISLLYVAAGLALWSLAVYIKIMWKRLAR